MPAIGVYAYSYSLHEVLSDTYHSLNDRSILCDLLIQPILDIHRDVVEGLNPFIGRERYRAWTKLVDEHIGPVDLPDWDTMNENDEWSWSLFNLIESCCSMEWEIYFSDGAMVEDAIAAIDLSNVSMDSVLDQIERESLGRTYFLALVHHALGAIYIIRSPNVENRGPCNWGTREGYHLYESVADGEDYGPLETYVLTHEDLELWQKEGRE